MKIPLRFLMTKRLSNKQRLVRIYAGLRRRYLWYFRRQYVLDSLSKRKGHCLRCGKCCTGYCKFLKGKLCTVHGCQLQPLSCQIGFLDKKHLRLSGLEGICGYYWDDK